MTRRWILLGCAGLLLLTWLVWPVLAASYPNVTIYGRFNGAPKAITTTANGYVNVVVAGGPWAATNGGTGQTTVTTGDLLYGSATNTWSKLADVVAGSYLRSGGATTAPVWSTITLPNALTTGDLVTATGTNAAGAVAAVASGQVLTSAGTSTVPAYSANPSVTTATASRTALATTSTDGLITTNATAATMGTAVQISPRVRLRGNAWDTSASQTVDFFMETLPASAATPTGTFKLGYSLNGATATYPLTVASTGVTTVAGSLVVSSGNTQIPTTGAFYINGWLQYRATADGAANITNNAGTGFTSLAFAGDLIYSFTVPTITSGFSTSTPSIAGKASSFAVTIGTPTVASTTGLVAFNSTFTNIPSCSCMNTITANLCQAVPTATGVTLNGVWVASDILRVSCLGY